MEIIITDQIVGQTHLYEKVGKQGRRAMVPTYHAIFRPFQPDYFNFAVTRDSSPTVFGEKITRYGQKGECPPNRPDEPYLAKRNIEREGIPFSLRLFENEGDTLRGITCFPRKDILIHHGPACSYGCFCVAGGRRGFANFRRAIEEYVEIGQILRVYVQERSASHVVRKF